MTDDHSRVVLEKIEGDPKSDYINASYIPVSTTPIPRSTVHFKSTSRYFEFSIVLLKKTYYRAIFQLTIESNLVLQCLALLPFFYCSCKFVPLSRSLRFKTEVNFGLGCSCFPRFRQFECIFFELSLAH